MFTAIPFRDADYEQRLAKMLTSSADAWSLADEADREYLRSVPLQATCPVCGAEYSIYDRNNDRVRSFCSVACSNKSRISRKWQCVLCGRRFTGDWGLQLHIHAMHPEYDMHEYIVEYLRSKGCNIDSLKRYCVECGHERTLNFACCRYDQCVCVAAEAKLKRLEAKLENQDDPRVRSKLGRQIGGLKTVINRYRRKPSGDPQNSDFIPNGVRDKRGWKKPPNGISVNEGST